MKKLDRSGFSAIEAIIALVIICVIGGVGYAVYHHNKKTDDSIKSSSTQSSSAVSSLPKDAKKAKAAPKTYSDPGGKFSLQYPGTWVTATNPSLCSDGIFLVAPDAQSVGKCATENFGQISITADAGDVQSDNDLNGDPGFKNPVATNVSVAGVTGTRFQGVAASDPGGEGDFSVQASAFAFPVGSTVVRYMFFTNNTTYIATYVQHPSGAGSTNVLSDFDQMITQTLQFK
ncbi:MAG TPA: hypothetical protein VF401_03110 [Candidatus Saccharimonadales bacterium]